MWLKGTWSSGSASSGAWVSAWATCQ
jgi:hypothetical protein